MYIDLPLQAGLDHVEGKYAGPGYYTRHATAKQDFERLLRGCRVYVAVVVVIGHDPAAELVCPEVEAVAYAVA